MPEQKYVKIYFPKATIILGALQKAGTYEVREDVAKAAVKAGVALEPANQPPQNSMPVLPPARSTAKGDKAAKAQAKAVAQLVGDIPLDFPYAEELKAGGILRLETIVENREQVAKLLDNETKVDAILAALVQLASE